MDHAIRDREVDGFVKVHVKKGSDTIIGATIVARHAGDLISEITLAMTRKQRRDRRDRDLHLRLEPAFRTPHPRGGRHPARRCARISAKPQNRVITLRAEGRGPFQMVHNGIGYGLMATCVEGLILIGRRPERSERLTCELCRPGRPSLRIVVGWRAGAVPP